MQISSGALMLIKTKIANKFEIIGGLRTTRLVLNNEMIDVSSKTSGAWRQLMDQAGIRAISISGGGVFTNSDSENLIRNYAIANKLAEYQLSFGSGEVINGIFSISHYERSGNYQDEETYNITLESAGKIEWHRLNNMQQSEY